MSVSEQSWIPKDSFARSAKVVSVIDGDTLRLDIDLGWSAWLRHDVRLSGIDTPECRGRHKHEFAAGEYVKRVVEGLCPVGSEVWIVSREFQVGSFGRCLCDLYPGSLNGVSLNRYLLENKMAWPTNGSGKIIGERDIDALTGINIHSQDKKE